MAIQRLSHVTVLVHDQDEALRFYTERLGFDKRDDVTMGDFRWLTVVPRGGDVAIVLQRAVDGRAAQVGKGTTWVLQVDDVLRTYEELLARGVKFRGEPSRQPWGTEVACEDLYGNTFDLVEPVA
ncbi:MAG TPA: VOC family protein [Haliangiales bacterium]|nr:VOC family protein [Haliangiales bacterium]